MEQLNPRSYQNLEVWHDGSQGFPGRSADHEEVAAQQTDSVVRGVHTRRANLHHHRADETRIVAGVLARPGTELEPNATHRDVGSNFCWHGLPGVTELHSQGPGSQERSGRRQQHREDRRFRTRQTHQRKRVRSASGRSVPDQVDCPRGSQLQPFLDEK